MAQTQVLKHHGQIVEHAVRRSSISITALAKELKVSRRSIYNWFTEENLSIEIVDKIGKALRYDFSSEFPEILDLSFQLRTAERAVAEIQEGQDSAFYWKEKYIALLEAHNEYLLSGSDLQRLAFPSFQTSGFA